MCRSLPVCGVGCACGQPCVAVFVCVCVYVNVPVCMPSSCMSVCAFLCARTCVPAACILCTCMRLHTRVRLRVVGCDHRRLHVVLYCIRITNNCSLPCGSQDFRRTSTTSLRVFELASPVMRRTTLQTAPRSTLIGFVHSSS